MRSGGSSSRRSGRPGQRRAAPRPQLGQGAEGSGGNAGEGQGTASSRARAAGAGAGSGTQLRPDGTGQQAAQRQQAPHSPQDGDDAPHVAQGSEPEDGTRATANPHTHAPENRRPGPRSEAPRTMQPSAPGERNDAERRSGAKGAQRATAGSGPLAQRRSAAQWSRRGRAAAAACESSVPHQGCLQDGRVRGHVRGGRGGEPFGSGGRQTVRSGRSVGGAQRPAAGCGPEAGRVQHRRGETRFSIRAAAHREAVQRWATPAMLLL